MQTQSFKIKYDGTALSGGQMDIKELAPALLALGEAIELANNTLNDGKTTVKVNVQGNFQSGSFSVYLMVGQDLIQQLSGFFNSDTINSILNIRDILVALGILGGGSIGLIQLIKIIRNREITNVTEIEEGNVKITLQDGTMVESSKKTIRLFSHSKIREGVSKFIAGPLSQQGIDSFATYNEFDEQVEQITKEDAAYFTNPNIQDVPLGEDIITTSVQLVSISFKEGNKRKLSDGASVFSANVLDKGFLDSIQNNTIRFAKDDILKVRLNKKQRQTTTGIKTEYELTEVIEHRPAAIQLELPFSE